MLVHLIDINVSAEIDEYPSLRFQDIRKKVTEWFGVDVQVVTLTKDSENKSLT